MLHFQRYLVSVSHEDAVAPLLNDWALVGWASSPMKMKRQPNTIGPLAVALIRFQASFPALPRKRIPRRRGSATAEWLGIGEPSEFANENVPELTRGTILLHRIQMHSVLRDLCVSDRWVVGRMNCAELQVRERRRRSQRMIVLT